MKSKTPKHLKPVFAKLGKTKKFPSNPPKGLGKKIVPKKKTARKVPKNAYRGY